MDGTLCFAQSRLNLASFTAFMIFLFEYISCSSINFSTLSTCSLVVNRPVTVVKIFWISFFEWNLKCKKYITNDNWLLEIDIKVFGLSTHTSEIFWWFSIINSRTKLIWSFCDNVATKAACLSCNRILSERIYSRYFCKNSLKLVIWNNYHFYMCNHY